VGQVFDPAEIAAALQAKNYKLAFGTRRNLDWSTTAGIAKSLSSRSGALLVLDTVTSEVSG
jgi:hypothetical protein